MKFMEKLATFKLVNYLFIRFYSHYLKKDNGNSKIGYKSVSQLSETL